MKLLKSLYLMPFIIISLLFAFACSDELGFLSKMEEQQDLDTINLINPCVAIDEAALSEPNSVLRKMFPYDEEKETFTVMFQGKAYDCDYRPPPPHRDYYVSTQGSNSTGNGTALNPWATIGYAVANADSIGGFSIIVKDGVYEGRTYITAKFDNWVTIKAENPLKVKLTNVTNGSEVFGIFGNDSKKIIVEGFYFSNWHPTYTCPNGREPNVMVHFESGSDIIFRNNILYGNNAPGTCNELLKINRGTLDSYPKNIQIKGNILYDRPSAGGTDLLDSVRPGELDISDNIFFDRTGDNGQSFITIKRQAPAELVDTPRSPRFKINRNVFLNWAGKDDQAFIQFGEDWPDTPQISSALIENNLFLGNSSDDMAAPMQFKDSENITVRANTIVGDFVDSFHGFRMGTEIQGSIVRDIIVMHNIFSDPTGTMRSMFTMVYGEFDYSGFYQIDNLYWNGEEPFPEEDWWLGNITPYTDMYPRFENPMIGGDQSNIVLPVWDFANSQFESGNTTIREEFERLVFGYGAIGTAQPSVSPMTMPEDDILGRTRGINPDLGAFEFFEGLECQNGDCGPPDDDPLECEGDCGPPTP